MPCLHKRVTKATYDSLVLKVRSKLVGWKDENSVQVPTCFTNIDSGFDHTGLCHADDQTSIHLHKYHEKVMS